MEHIALETQCNTGITCETFCNRMYKCYYFKEKYTYVKNATILFNRILKNYILNKSFYPVFSEFFSSRAYIGKNAIPSDDKKVFKTFCIKLAINLDRFLTAYRITEVMKPYIYKWKIKGFMHLVAVGNNSTVNVSLSFKDLKETEKDLEFYCINNHLYNVSNKTKRDLLVIDIQQDMYYYIRYEDKDYTIKRGFSTFSRGNKIRKQGEHCINCVHSCKPQFYNGLERLALTL